ncbi:clumping factor B-like [Brienomyrus brachyistius]|uniref:clumping factor B-like n=1 Tax=Brienomyrus brachyistius TaxID=42636 RepID=UPI0020B32680|nr:clumping factor B-like [Brienomyrus brachyistius]
MMTVGTGREDETPPPVVTTPRPAPEPRRDGGLTEEPDPDAAGPAGSSDPPVDHTTAEHPEPELDMHLPDSDKDYEDLESLADDLEDSQASMDSSTPVAKVQSDDSEPETKPSKTKRKDYTNPGSMFRAGGDNEKEKEKDRKGKKKGHKKAKESEDEDSEVTMKKKKSKGKKSKKPAPQGFMNK